MKVKDGYASLRSRDVDNARHTFAFPRRDAPELCMNRCPKEGVGNAGCPLHPQPRAQCRKHTR